MRAEIRKVALEYERSAKSTKQYKRIAGILNGETKVTCVLYLVCNVQMESFLLNGLRGTRRQVYVSQAHQFAEHPPKRCWLTLHSKCNIGSRTAFPRTSNK